MNRFQVTFLGLALVGTVFSSHAQSLSARKLTAPTFYIAARAANELQSEVDVHGVTNLPPGAKLTVELSDYIGEGASDLSELAFPVVSDDGSFEVSIYPKRGKLFPKTSTVCSIVFMPTSPRQSQAVLRVVGGIHGTALGDARNPLIGLGSGDHWYLQDLVYVPPVPRLPNAP